MFSRVTWAIALVVSVTVAYLTLFRRSKLGMTQSGLVQTAFRVTGRQTQHLRAPSRVEYDDGNCFDPRVRMFAQAP
jgi:hypothetical protein